MQHKSHCDSSISDFNCSELVHNSDNKKTGETEDKDFDNPKQGEITAQQMINSQILNQLYLISQRLNKTEMTQCENTNEKMAS